METVKKIVFCLVVAPYIVLRLMLDMALNPKEYGPFKD